jgi:hypothetical protein
MSENSNVDIFAVSPFMSYWFKFHLWTKLNNIWPEDHLTISNLPDIENIPGRRSYQRTSYSDSLNWVWHSSGPACLTNSLSDILLIVENVQFPYFDFVLHFDFLSRRNESSNNKLGPIRLWQYTIPRWG